MDLTAAQGHLPEPTLTISLPSIHDGTLLDCRVYLPSSIVASASISSGAASERPVWRGDAAVVAHPYAPMGGSYNDPIVRLVAHALLTRGQFVVATFNFRGASSGKGSAGGSGSGSGSSWSNHRSSSSKKDKVGPGGGRTSWTAKAETADYMTVVGFLYYFVHVLDPYGWKADAAEAAETAGTATGEIETANTGTAVPSPRACHPAAFLCAGYSYGAMVTSLLPSIDTVLAHFARPKRGSPAAAVRWRAARWAAIENADLKEVREVAAAAAYRGGSLRSEARLSMGVRVGGGDVRRSHDASWRRSGERRSREFRHHHSQHHAESAYDATAGNHSHHHRHHRVRGLVARIVAGRPRSGSGSIGSSSEGEGERSKQDNDLLPAVPGLPGVRPAYLLVSPPVGLATHFATMSWGGSSSGASSAGTGETPESKLTANPTLVVYGDADGFVTHRTMRQWTARLTGASRRLHHLRPHHHRAAASSGTPRGQDQVLFRALEIQTAGHFWVEGRTLYELEAAVRAFAEEVVHDGKSQAVKAAE